MTWTKLDKPDATECRWHDSGERFVPFMTFTEGDYRAQAVHSDCSVVFALRLTHGGDREHYVSMSHIPEELGMAVWGSPILHELDDIGSRLRGLERQLENVGAAAGKAVSLMPAPLRHDVRTELEITKRLVSDLRNVVSSPLLGSLQRTQSILERLSEWFEISEGGCDDQTKEV